MRRFFRKRKEENTFSVELSVPATSGMALFVFREKLLTVFDPLGSVIFQSPNVVGRVKSTGSLVFGEDAIEMHKVDHELVALTWIENLEKGEEEVSLFHLLMEHVTGKDEIREIIETVAYVGFVSTMCPVECITSATFFHRPITHDRPQVLTQFAFAPHYDLYTRNLFDNLGTASMLGILQLPIDQLLARGVIDKIVPCTTLNISNTSIYSGICNGNLAQVRYARKDYMFRGVGSKFGIANILDYFIKLLCEKGLDMTSSANREMCKSIMLENCFCSLDYEKDCKDLESKGGVLNEVDLPDGSTIALGKECFQAFEPLFRPEILGFEPGSSIQHILFDSWKNDYTLNQIEENFLVLIQDCGDGIKGLQERLVHEFMVLYLSEIGSGGNTEPSEELTSFPYAIVRPETYSTESICAAALLYTDDDLLGMYRARMRVSSGGTFMG